MATWKDEQFKDILRQSFNIPNYIDSIDDIIDYIGKDVYAKGYNEAKHRTKKYLERKKFDYGIDYIVSPIELINEILDERFDF